MTKERKIKIFAFCNILLLHYIFIISAKNVAENAIEEQLLVDVGEIYFIRQIDKCGIKFHTFFLTPKFRTFISPFMLVNNQQNNIFVL